MCVCVSLCLPCHPDGRDAAKAGEDPLDIPLGYLWVHIPNVHLPTIFEDTRKTNEITYNIMSCENTRKTNEIAYNITYMSTYMKIRGKQMKIYIIIL